MFVVSTQKHWQHVGSLPAIAVVGILVFSGTMIPLRAQGNQRPLSDFLNAQGTTQCFTPPAQAQLGWATGTFPDGSVKTNGNTGLTPARFALIDYTGLEAKYLLSQGIDLGTTVSGSVMERPLADGRALVTVDLQTRNALGWAFDIDPSLTPNSTPLAFGSRVLDVVAGKQPGLGDAHFRVVFTNTGPGAPLPPCAVTSGWPPPGSEPTRCAGWTAPDNASASPPARRNPRRLSPL